jgi:AraC-like DNA-binding protein
MFTPTGAAALLREPVELLFNGTMPLESQVRRSHLDLVEEQLFEASDHIGRVRVVERFLLQQLRARTPDTLVAFALDRIRRSRGTLRIDSLARHTGLSQSALERRFRNEIGASPKKFAALVRLRHVIRLRRAGARLVSLRSHTPRATPISRISSRTSSASRARHPRPSSRPRRPSVDPGRILAARRICTSAKGAAGAKVVSMKITAPRFFFSRRMVPRMRLIAYGVAIAFSVTASTAQSTSHTQTEGAPMKEFAFIFRQTVKTLTPEQQKQRAEEAREWAVRLRDEGHKMNPHLLASETYLIPPESAPSSNGHALTGDPIVALLLIDFPSFEEAKKAAQSHPGLHYGVSIEIREATAPPAVPTAAQAASHQ